MSIRPSSRLNNQLRPMSFEININKWAEGSCLVSSGQTKVLCTASIEPNQPLWKRQQNKTGGWVSAEYNLLPRSVNIRKNRESQLKDHRTAEISRLIGRSFRSIVDLEKLGKHTIIVDCDVLQADGGTRCASINGGFIALSLAIRNLINNKKINDNPIKSNAVAISCGLYKDEYILDLDFIEDSHASLDANFVMDSNLNFIEIQMTGEQHPFNNTDLINLLDLAKSGCKKIIALQNKILNS